MKPGTIIKLPDGREGTIVYSGLDGYGFVWGRQEIDVDAILNTNSLFNTDKPIDVPTPEAMLRDQYPGADIECVGSDYEIVSAEPKEGGE